MRKAFGFLACVFVAAVWLNQSIGSYDWEKVRDEVFADPSAHLLDTVRYPFTFLYRRSGDEQMYFTTAAKVFGQPYDHVLEPSRGDTPGWLDAGSIPADGRLHVPYAEVPLEYPPIALPFILLPKLVTSSLTAYARLFGLLMAACLVGAIGVGIGIARRAGDSVSDRWWLGAGLLLAHGGIAIQRLDAVVALFLALAVRAAVRERPVQLGLFAGLAGAAKLVPILVLPVLVAADPGLFKNRGRLARVAGGAAAGLALGFAPLIAVPHAVADILHYHSARGLHVESTFGVLLGALRMVGGAAQPAVKDFGSMNLHGAVADALAQAAAPVTLFAVGALVLHVAHAEVPQEPAARTRRLVGTALAACVVLWLSGKVFSPQYMTWGIPLALAIPGAAHKRVAWVLLLALAVSQLYLRGYYDYVSDQRPLGILTLVVRQAVLFALLVMALRVAAHPSYSQGHKESAMLLSP